MCVLNVFPCLRVPAVLGGRPLPAAAASLALMSLPALLLSQSTPPTTAGAGALGLFILLSMGAATALLIGNMNSRLKRLPRSYTGLAPEHARDVPANSAADQEIARG